MKEPLYTVCLIVHDIMLLVLEIYGILQGDLGYGILQFHHYEWGFRYYYYNIYLWIEFLLHPWWCYDIFILYWFQLYSNNAIAFEMISYIFLLEFFFLSFLSQGFIYTWLFHLPKYLTLSKDSLRSREYYFLFLSFANIITLYFIKFAKGRIC